MTPTQTADLTSILPGLGQGERVAVAAAYGSYGGPVTTIAYGVLGDGDLAGRAVLATFYRISEAAPKLSGGVDPSMLIYSLARTEITDLWQAETERRRAADGTVSGESLGAIALDATGSAWDVRRAIDQLDEDEQTLLKLVHFAAMTPSAIIEYLSLSVDELKSLSKRAHRELATTLSGIESGEDHSLNHVTSLLCSDAMWTSTSEPMIDSIMAVIAAGPESLGPLPSAETSEAPEPTTAPASSLQETTAGDSKAAPVLAAAAAPAIDEPGSNTSGPDSGAVRISPVRPAAEPAGMTSGTETTATSVVQIVDDQGLDESRSPGADLPWNKSTDAASPSEPDESARNGAATFSSAAGAQSEVTPLASVAPLRSPAGTPGDADRRRSLTPAADADAAARRAHLPLPDPVSAPTPAVQDAPHIDINRLPAVPAAEEEVEKKRMRFKISGSSLLAIAAIVIGSVMGIATLISMQGNSGVVGTQTVIRLAGTERLPNATALVTLSEAPSGVEVYLEFEQLDGAPENTFFQGWAETVAGDQIPLGTFHLRLRPASGDAFVALWAGVDLQQMSSISVRLQDVGGPNEPSDKVLLNGPIVPIG